MKKARWIIQGENYAEKDRKAIISSCEKLGIPCEQIKVIPFSDQLPDFPINEEYENIYYGSTTMMDRIYRDYHQSKGLFYDDVTFSMENYLRQWGTHMLSSEAQFLTFKEFRNADHPSDQKFFIRPDADSKAFAGMVLEFGEITDWFDRVAKENVKELSPETKIMVGPAYHIEKEWRNYIVKGKVVTSSLYRKNFQLYKSADDIPAEMIHYVEARCKEYQPHDVFAMDIAKCSGKHEYYIIECGCMNSVGFYHADIHEFVKSLSEYIEGSK